MRVERRSGRTGGRQRIDYSEAEQLLRAGATQQEVGDRFEVSQGAVSAAIVRGRIKDVGYDRSTTADSGVPWHPIRPEHRSKYLVRMLRAAKRREQGKRSAPKIEAELDSFLEKFEQGDWVVHYDPETEQGFWRVPRRVGIDKGLVRDPWVDDVGSPTPHAANVRRGFARLRRSG